MENTWRHFLILTERAVLICFISQRTPFREGASVDGRQNPRHKLLANGVELMVTGVGEDLCAKCDILSGCVTQPFSDARAK